MPPQGRPIKRGETVDSLVAVYACLNEGALHRGGLTLQNEWRQLGVQQSRGWVHYAIHRPEPHIMLFRCQAPPVPSHALKLV